MRWRRYPLVGLEFVVTFFFATITFAATTILIDEFTTPQTVCAGSSCTGNQTSVVSSASGDILGNERDMQIGVSSGSGTITMTADLGYLSFKQDSGTGGPAEVVWDGADNNPTSVSTQDMSESFAGLNDLLFTFVPTTQPMEGNVTIYCQASGSQTFSLNVPDVASGGYVDYVIPISPTLSPACMDAINAIQLSLLGNVNPGNDVIISTLVVTSARDYNDLDGYPTASHIPDGLRLGDKVDAEHSARLGTDGLGDDNDRQDDDDGVVRDSNSQWQPGKTVTMTVTVNGCRTSPCYLSGWIDWGRDNVYNTADRIWNDVQVSNGISRLTATVPVDVANQTLSARFRICDTANTCNTPDATDVQGGEIEEYRWSFGPTSVQLETFAGTRLPGSTSGLRGGLVLALVSVALLIWRRVRVV